MKRIFCIFFILISSFLIFTGCKKNQINTSGDSIGEDSNSDSLVSVGIDETYVESSDEVDGEEEKNQIQENISQMEEIVADSEIEEDTVLPAVNENKEPEEIFVTDSKGKLKLFSYDDELLMTMEENGYTVLISANKKSVERNYYDSQNRFVRKENWSIPNIDDAKLLKTQIYKYSDGSYKPSQKISEKDNSRTYYSYDEFSNPVTSKEYLLYIDSKSNAEKEVLLSESEYSYNSDKKLILQIVNEYEYSDAAYKNVKSKLEKKLEYAYNNGNEIPPDYTYSENDIVRLKRVYSKVPGNYVEQVFFGQGYSVKTIVENNFKIKDIYTLNGLTVRETYYE